MSARTGFSVAQIRLHWIIAALIVIQFVFHEWMVEAWDIIEKGGTVAFSPLVASHVFGGIAVLLLVLWRLVLRFRRGVPLPPENEPALLQLMAHIVHWSLYALMILMPLSGMAAWFLGVEAAAEAHGIMRIFMLVLVAIHILASLFHHFILKSGVLLRMKNPVD
tara:strand:+ start:37156 stop:37647 length:492 start_codon:yes stop_codon:yes gene_type:complete